jgi:hypothetical protein
MPRKKADPGQAALTGKAFGKGPAEQPTAVDPPKRKMPTAVAIKEMATRFRGHAQAVRDLLSDVQKIASENWPIADPDFAGNLADQVRFMLEPAEHETEGVPVVLLDCTLANLLGDIDAIADDLDGPDMGEWVRAIVSPSKPAEPARVAGTPSKGKATK